MSEHQIAVEVRPVALELPEKTAIRRSSSSKLVNVPSAERVAHLRRLSNFLPATVRTPRSYRRTGSRAAGVPTTNVSNARARKKKSQSLDSRTGNPIWADDESDEDDNDTRNADCLGGRPQSKRSKFQQGGQPTRRDSDSRSESANNSVASSSHLRNVSSIPEVDDDPHPDPLNKDELSMNFDDAKDIDNTCCAIHQYIHNWCLDLFTDMEYDVDRERVHVHWFTNQFYPPIYEEAFVRQTSQHGLEKSIGLLLFVWAVGGAYTLSSANKLGFKEDHEADKYLFYFMVRLIGWLTCTFIVAIDFLCCEPKLRARSRSESLSSDIGDENSIGNDAVDTNVTKRKEFISYKNGVLAVALVIFGAVSMFMKAYKVRYEGVAVGQNLNASLHAMNTIYDDTWKKSHNSSSLAPATYASMCSSTDSIVCSSFTILNDHPQMNPNMTLREMVFAVHTNSVVEYEVIMNRIWPPLITITCALVVKRFIPTVTVAVTMAICWLIVFLSGPLNQRWYKEWQETAFVFMSLLIVLFGSKSEDRQERENFLNTFGKHLKAARVQERLANMRKAMDESIAPQTALGSIIKKLNQVQQMMKGQTATNDCGRNVDDDELFMIDDIKSLLLSNVGKLAAPTVSANRWDNVSPEERAWMQQGGLGGEHQPLDHRSSTMNMARPSLSSHMVNNSSPANRKRLLNSNSVMTVDGGDGLSEDDEHSERSSGEDNVIYPDDVCVENEGDDEKQEEKTEQNNGDLYLAGASNVEESGTNTDEDEHDEKDEKGETDVTNYVLRPSDSTIRMSISANMKETDSFVLSEEEAKEAMKRADSSNSMLSEEELGRTAHGRSRSASSTRSTSPSPNNETMRKTHRSAKSERTVLGNRASSLPVGSLASPLNSPLRVPRVLSTKEQKLRTEISKCRKHNWNRNMLAIQDKGFNPCLVLGMGIASSHTFLKRFDIKKNVWATFCTLIGEGYKKSNPYHNACHGADVMNSVHYILDYAGLRRSRGLKYNDLSSSEFFGALLAALIHDFKHPGLNTTHVKKARHPLNLQYLDDSPLERMHVAEAYMMCADPSNNVNIFSNMTTSDYMNVRHAVVTLVLATDLAHHFGFVEKLKLTTTDHSTGLRGSSGSTNERQKYVDMQLSLGAQNVDNMTVMKIAIKLSDIGHCAKELSLHLKWSELVNEEFYMQGDIERSNTKDFPNGPEPLWDRNQSNLMPKNQANFIRIFITPFHNIVSELFPTMSYVKNVAANNFLYWDLFNSESDADMKKNERQRTLMVEASNRKLELETDESIQHHWKDGGREEEKKTDTTSQSSLNNRNLSRKKKDKLKKGMSSKGARDANNKKVNAPHNIRKTRRASSVSEMRYMTNDISSTTKSKEWS